MAMMVMMMMMMMMMMAATVAFPCPSYHQCMTQYGCHKHDTGFSWKVQHGDGGGGGGDDDDDGSNSSFDTFLMISA